MTEVLPCGHTEGTRTFPVTPEDPEEKHFERKVCLICGRWVGDKPLFAPDPTQEKTVQYFTPEITIEELFSE